MTDEQFAAACAAIETIAINNALLINANYGATAEDVQAIVRMARSLRLNHRDEAERVVRA